MPDPVSPTPRDMAEFAHELRAPLGGLQAMIEVLAESELTPSQRETLDALSASALHLRQIANRILGDADPACPPAPSRMMVRPFLNRLGQSAAARAKIKGLDFAMLQARDLPMSADLDPLPLRQVLENLIDNAIRLTPTGRVVLAVAPAGPGRITFRISDAGPGLSAEDAQRLIAEGGSLEGRPGGSGLGLKVAGRLVAERGGALQGGPNCDGLGASFAFDWPLLAELSDPACLIVDDHPASRAVLRTVLQAAGHSCLEAASVEDAKAMLAEIAPAHLITDLRLGDESGADLVRWVVARKSIKRPRIIVVSADPLESEPDLARLVDASIRKPVNVRAILEAVRLPRQVAKPAA